MINPSEAQLEGERDFRSGLSTMSCPYAHQPARDNWLRGWELARLIKQRAVDQAVNDAFPCLR